MRLGLDMEPAAVAIADAIREASANIAFAIVACAVVWLIGTLWKWRT